jgi:hypothetical protein
MTKTEEKTSVSAEEVKNTPNENGEEKVVLLGSISYSDEFQYEEWLKKMDLNQSVFVLVAAANYAQSKGLLTLAESELVAGALRTIKKNSKQSPVSQPEGTKPPEVVMDKK